MNSPGTDTQGRSWLTFDQALPNTKVKVDGDFSCIPEGAIRTIKIGPNPSKDARLWIDCMCGRHYLDGQEDLHGGKFYVGLYPAKV